VIAEKGMCMEVTLWRWSCVFISLSKFFSTSPLCCYPRRTVIGCKPSMYLCLLVFDPNLKSEWNQEV